MNLALFGGTFDPIHLGHIAIARAAAERFQLKQVLFCPAYVSPFKADARTAAYAHRFGMVALATQEDPLFLASDLESPEVTGNTGPNYTIDTILRLRSQLGKSDRLFFLCGADAFLGIAKWKEPEQLLASCEFIVAARPGYGVAEIAAALPPKLRPAPQVLKVSRDLPSENLVLPGLNLHLLPDTHEPASSTAVRKRQSSSRSRTAELDPVVAAYIKKHKLYKSSAASGIHSKKRTG